MAEPLTSDQWAEHYNLSILDGLVDGLSSGQLSWQTREMMNHSKPGEKVLEIGSGSGATTLHLARNGRVCTALDYTQVTLDLAQKAAERLACEISTVNADATSELPFAENAFDVVFQAGLLEHFQKEERIRLLRLWSRVARRMVSIIPNAGSIAYRVGKALMEKKGTWSYGLELPQYSLHDEFVEAGLKVTGEYTIGETHALEFLPKYHPLRLMLAHWIANNPCEDNCGQGYLLVTIGEKP